MPRIHDYSTEISAQAAIGGRRAQAGDFGTGIDTGAGLTSAADTLYDTAQRQEVSTIDAEQAKARSQLTLDLRDMADKSEPGDATFADRFRERLDKVSANFDNMAHTAAGRRAARAAQASLVSDFMRTAGLYQAKSAGDKAVRDYSDGLNANRNTLITDPYQFESVLSATERALSNPAGPYAKMPADKREQLRNNTRQELALSAVQGQIRMDPEGALDQLKTGKWAQYLDADKTFTMQRSAEIAIRANELERDRIDRAKAKAQVEAQRATENEFISKLVEDPTSLSPKDVAKSNLLADDKLKWLGIIGKVGKPEAIKTDAGVYLDTYQRIQLPPDDPRHLGEDDLPSLVGHGLRLEDVNSFRSEIQGKKTEAGRIEGELKDGLLKLAKTSLTGTDPLFRLRDPKGDEQLQKFTAWFLPEYARQRQAGKTAVQLLNPESPDYLGKALDQYKRSPAQFMKDMIDSNPGADVLGGGPASPAASDVAKRATRTARSPKGETIYFVDGKWVQPDGSDVDAAGSSGFSSADEVTQAYRNGHITRERAAEILREKGWAQ